MIKQKWQYFAGWLLHAFTASGGIVGVFALYAITQGALRLAFFLVGIAIIIDAVDGAIARFLDVKKHIPNMDGALLDNITDYFNYTLLPAFFILMYPGLLPNGWSSVSVVLIILASSYQFCQNDAKTADHFFKGFPSYWNIAVFYLFFWEMNAWVNLSLIAVCALLSFVPIKFIYPSRMECLTKNILLRKLMYLATIAWGAVTVSMVLTYPDSHPSLTWLSMGYLAVYVIGSIYRTLYPLDLEMEE